MNAVRPLVLSAICGCVAVLGCTSVSSVPLGSPDARTATEANSHTATSRWPVSPRQSATRGATNEGATATGDPRIGVHKPSDDTRINSGAGDAIPEGSVLPSLGQ